MNHVDKFDFTGQQIYVGMDVRTIRRSAGVFACQFEHKARSQPPEREVPVNSLKRNVQGAPYTTAYEAGVSGFRVHDRLQEQWSSASRLIRPMRLRRTGSWPAKPTAAFFIKKDRRLIEDWS